MKYTITVFPVADTKIAKILARYITSRGNQTAFSELIEMIQHEEYQYAHGVTKAEMESIKKQLEALGVKMKIMPIEEVVSTEKVAPPAALHDDEKSTLSTPPIADTPSNVRKREKVSTMPSSHVEEEVATISNTVQRAKKSRFYFAISGISVGTIIVILLLFFASRQKGESFDISNAKISGLGAGGGIPAEQVMRPYASSSEQKIREALDSADQLCVSSGINIEKMYRFAISYNKLNKDAWFALLNCYQITDRTIEFAEVSKEMKVLFGNDILVPEVFLDEYGDHEKVNLSESAGAFIYQSNLTDMNLLYSELFQVTRRISAMGTVKSLTVLAKMRDGKGIFLTISLGSCLEYYDFISQGTFQEMK